MKRFYKIFTLIIVFAFTFSSYAQTVNDNERDETLVGLLKYVLTNGHYEPQDIDDDFSILVYDDFLEKLDPTKRYFTQNDIDEFAQYKTLIDNQIRDEKIDFFKLVHNRFLERVQNAKTFTETIAQNPHDFIVDETFELDYEKRTYARNETELYDIWRKQLKFSTISRLHDKISEENSENNGLKNTNLSKFEKEFRRKLNDSEFVFNTTTTSVEEFKQIQQILTDNNINVGIIDGKYGRKTARGILNYQKKLNKKAPKVSNSKLISLETEAREGTSKNYVEFFERMDEFENIDWFASYLNAITESFDPHSSYFAPRNKKSFDESLSGKLEGIGARLSQRNDYTKVSELISGGPAWKAGDLEVGDIILKVAQGDEEPLDIVGMRLSKAIEFIKGPKGTEVQLTIKKIDNSIEVISIIRDVVELEETFLKSSVIEKDGKKYGVILLPKFYVDFKDRNARNCATDMAIEIERLKEENIDGLLIDLRNNGGGSLPKVVEMAGLFIKDGPIVQVKYKGDKPIVRKDRDKSIVWDKPLVVLTNELSASASEIFAAAMQDYKRAVIIGSKQTYGKGTVQNVLDLNQYVKSDYDLGGMTLTIQKFYRINGGSTQLEGVKPDVILPSRYTFMDVGEKDYENPLAWDQIKKANYKTWNQYSNFDDVIAKSVERINQNPQFTLINENAKWLKENQEDTTVYLNYDTYKTDLENHSEKSKKYDDLYDYTTNLTFNSPLYELPLIENDSVLGTKRKVWHKNLAKDIYIEEGINILGDLKLKGEQLELVKN